MRSDPESRKSGENGTLIFYTKACPDPSCSGRYEDIFSTFTVICKDGKHKGGQTTNLQNAFQRSRSIKRSTALDQEYQFHVKNQ